MKNYKLDESLLPEVWVTWLGSNGRIWANNKGKRQKHPEPWMAYDGKRDVCHCYRGDDLIPIGNNWCSRNKDKIWVNSGSQLMYAYAKYHKDIDRLEIAAVKYDTTRKETKHEWSFVGDRFFIAKDKSVINQDGVPCTNYFNVKKNYTAYRAKDMISCILRLTTNDKFMQEFKKFIGNNYFSIGNGTVENIKYPYQLSKWYISKQKVRTKGKAQELTDKLTAIPLSDIEHLAYKYKPITHRGNYRSYTISNIIYFERVDDEWSVLRALVRNENDTFEETWRVYLSDSGDNRIVSKSYGVWIPSKQPNSWQIRSSYYFANVSEAEEKCNRIKYILPMLKDNHNDVSYMITTFRFPEIEQLYKMGYVGIANSLACSNTPKADIKQKFGGYYNEKGNNVLRKIGLTKYQLDTYVNKCAAHDGRYGDSPTLTVMRKIFGNDLSRIDNVTYDEYIDAVNSATRNFWSMRNIDTLNVDESRFWKNLIRIGKKNPQIYNVVNDTINAYKYLNPDEPEIDWMFDSYSDAVRTHNAIIELKNERERERRAYWDMAEAERRKKDDERRKKVDEERKCYEYEDEDFIIRLPKNVLEIITEGSAQRICIGGYTTRHSKGDTNLFFLRKKSDEDTPFYAIEMDKNKHIVQIHGFGNKWLGCNPEAIPTVIRWLRKNDIKCKDSILTCKATGYGHINSYVPMPVVD